MAKGRVNGGPSPLWAPLLSAALLLAVAGPTVSRAPLSRDEWATWLFSRLSYPDLARATDHVDAAFLPYYALAHLTPAAEAHPFLLRLWSLLAAAVAVALTARVAAMVWGGWAGLLAGVLLACNGSLVGWAQTARPAALAAMFTALATYLLVRARLRGARWWWWVGYALAVAAAGASALFAVAVLIPHTVGALLWWRRGADGRRKLAGFAVAAVGALVLLVPVVISTSGQAGQIAWIRDDDFTGAYRILEHAAGVSSTDTALTWIGRVVLAGSLAVLLSAAVLRRRSGGATRTDGPDDSSAGDATTALAIALLVAPPLLLWLVSALDRPVEIGRYAIAVPEGAALTVTAAAVGCARLVRRRARRTATGRVGRSDRGRVIAGVRDRQVVGVALAVAALVAQTGLLADRLGTPQRDTRAAAGLVEDVLRRGQTVMFVQNYDSGGLIAGIAYAAGDRALLRTLERQLPDGAQLIVSRRVVGVRPLHTVATGRITTPVLVLGRVGPDRVRADPAERWQGRLRRDGCRPLRAHRLRFDYWLCSAGPPAGAGPDRG